jgi:integrase
MQYWAMVLRTPKTRDFYFQAMSNLLEWLPDIDTPDALLQLSDGDAVDVIRKYSYKYEQEGKQKMAQMVKTVFKSFFAANNRELQSVHLKVRKVAKTTKTYTKIVPTKEQVYAMADASPSLRDRAIILTLWQSGLRNQTLRNLTVRHIKEGLLNGDIPLKIEITPDIDKKNLREPYYTFLDKDAIDAVKTYLGQRSPIPDLPSEEPLFTSTLKRSGKIHPVSDAAVRRAVKTAARNAGIDDTRIWPHCLRAGFYNMLVGKVDDVEREFMFGHEMGVRSHYFASQWEEKLKNAYLDVGWRRESLGLTKEDVRTEIIGALMGKIDDMELAPIARKLGISPQQIRSMIQRIRSHGANEETEALIHTEQYSTSNNRETRLIDEDALCEHLNDGWEFIKELSSGRIVVKKAVN